MTIQPASSRISLQVTDFQPFDFYKPAASSRIQQDSAAYLAFKQSVYLIADAFDMKKDLLLDAVGCCQLLLDRGIPCIDNQQSAKRLQHIPAGCWFFSKNSQYPQLLTKKKNTSSTKELHLLYKRTCFTGQKSMFYKASVV